jgi:5,10-methylenetetrahydromethanopterin reductase
MNRIGLRLEPLGFAVGDVPAPLTFEEIRRMTMLAEARGYESVWMPEGLTRDTVSQLTALALTTERITLATGVLGVFTRTPTTIATSAGSLDLFSEGRFILGLGVGHQLLTEDGHGVPFERPIARARETIEIVRSLMAGGSIDYEGKVFRLRDARLGFEPFRQDLPIYLAALRPRMVETAATVADGILLNFASRGYVERAVASIRRAAENAGRAADAVDVAAYVRVAVVDDVESIKPSLRGVLAGRMRLPYYRSFFDELGFAANTGDVVGALERGDVQAASDAVPDKMLSELFVAGPADHCLREIQALRDAGLNLPIISPVPIGNASESYERTVEALAP